MSAIKPVSARPRSQATHAQVLASTVEMLDSVAFDKITIDKISTHSGVSTATLYKHWPSKTAIVAEAFGRLVEDRVPPRSSGHPLSDLVDFATASMTFHSAENSRVLVHLLAACAVEPSGAAYLQEYYLGPRRAGIKPLLQAAIDAEVVRDDVDADLAMDVIFGPAVFRLLRGADMDQVRTTINLSIAGLLR